MNWNAVLSELSRERLRPKVVAELLKDVKPVLVKDYLKKRGERTVKLRVPEHGDYIILMIMNKYGKTYPCWVTLKKATPLTIKKKNGRKYNYWAISFRIPAFFEGKIKVKVYKIQSQNQQLSRH